MGRRWGGGGGIKRVPPTSPLGLGLWLRAEPWGRGHLQGREKPTVLSRRRAAGERGTSRTRVTIVPVPGKVPAGREGADGDNRGRILRQSWVGAGGGGVPLGDSLWPVAHPGVPEELGRQVAAHAHHGAHPWSTPDPSHRTLAPPGPKGPVSAPTVSAWPCWSHHRTHHLLLALKDPS